MSKTLSTIAFIATAWYGLNEKMLSMEILFYVFFACKVALLVFATFCKKELLIECVIAGLSDKNYKIKNLLSWSLVALEFLVLFYIGEPLFAAILMMLSVLPLARIREAKREVVK